MKTVTVNVNHIRAALLCSSKSDLRYYLNGVLIELCQDDVRIVATDGHRLICLRSEYAEGESGGEHVLAKCEPRQIIIPRDVITGIKPVKGARKMRACPIGKGRYYVCAD